MDFREYPAALRKRWLSVVVITLTVLAAAAGITMSMTPMYTAATKMFFAVGTGESVSDLAQGSAFTEQQMGSYADVATDPVILVPVIEQLELDVSYEELAKTLSVEVPPQTVVMRITATHQRPDDAARIANAVAEQLAATVGDFSPDRADGEPSVQVTVTAPAEAPTSPSSPHVPRSLALGALLGLVLGLTYALAREMLDTRVRSVEDVEAMTDHPVIGSVGLEPRAGRHAVFMTDDPMGHRAEAVRRLRTNLRFVDLTDKPGSIVVTSSLPGEGKSTVSINLAVALADSGAKVLLVDADLRRPSVAEVMGLEGNVGLTTVLIGHADVGEVVQPWRETSLDVLPSGPLPPNPSEVLGSRAMSVLLDTLMESYDAVVIDSPPLVPVTDAAVLSRLAGGALLVAGADQLHRAHLRESLTSLANVDARVLGIVVNKVDNRVHRKHRYYSYRQEPHGNLASSTPSGDEPVSDVVRTRGVSGNRVKGQNPHESIPLAPPARRVPTEAGRESARTTAAHAEAAHDTDL